MTNAIAQRPTAQRLFMKVPPQCRQSWSNHGTIHAGGQTSFAFMAASCLGRQEHGCGNVSAGRPPTAAAIGRPTPAANKPERWRAPGGRTGTGAEGAATAYSAPGATGRSSAGSRRYRPITSIGTCSISIPHHRRRCLPTLGEARGFVEVQSQKLSMLSENFSLPRGAGGLTPSQPHRHACARVCRFRCRRNEAARCHFTPLQKIVVSFSPGHCSSQNEGVYM